MDALEVCNDLEVDYLELNKIISKGLLHVDHYDSAGSPVFAENDVNDYKDKHRMATIEYLNAIRNASNDDLETRNRAGHLTKEDKQDLIDLLKEIEESCNR